MAKLDDYFVAKIAESGRFRVVPRKELEAQLRDKKVESYNACYDQACQIEIGREVAAEKVLDTKIMEIAGECAVSATIYDLRTNATEGGASVKAGCSEKEVVASIEAVVARLQNPQSTPAPARVEQPVPSTSIPEKQPEPAVVAVTKAPERRGPRTELFGASLVVGAVATGAPVFGVQLRSPALHLGPIAWTLASADLHFLFGKRSTLEASPPFLNTTGGHLGFTVLLETRPALRLELTEHDTIQLGVGFGLWLTEADKYIDEEITAPVVSAGVHYLRTTDSALQWGLGVRGEFAIRGGCDFNMSDVLMCSVQSPQMLLGEVILGYAD